MGPAVTSSVGQFAIGRALTERSVHGTGTRVASVLVGDGDVNVGGYEGHVEDDGDEGGEGVAGQAAQQEQADEGVERCGAGDALDGADRVRYREGVVVQGREEVRVYGEDESRGTELDSADEPLQELQGERHLCTSVGFALRVVCLRVACVFVFGETEAEIRLNFYAFLYSTFLLSVKGCSSTTERERMGKRLSIR